MLAWVDLETTGLDANNDVILEVGIVLTEDNLVEIARASWLIVEQTNYYRDAVTCGHANPFVEDMHNKSGLWDALADANRDGTALSLVEADEAISVWLRDCGVKLGEPPMCGNSIGSLDRPFILRQMPLVNETLSYRNIDISTFKEVCRRVNKGLFENLKPIVDEKGDAQHRTLSDIDASIREYQSYLDNLIITGDEYP